MSRRQELIDDLKKLYIKWADIVSELSEIDGHNVLVRDRGRPLAESVPKPITIPNKKGRPKNDQSIASLVLKAVLGAPKTAREIAESVLSETNNLADPEKLTKDINVSIHRFVSGGLFIKKDGKYTRNVG